MSSHSVKFGKYVNAKNGAVHKIKSVHSDARVQPATPSIDDNDNHSSSVPTNYSSINGTGLLEERLMRLKINPISVGLPTRKKNISFVL